MRSQLRTSPRRNFRATPMPKYPPPLSLSHSQSFSSINSLNLSLHTQQRSLERIKFDKNVKIIQNQKQKSLKVLKEIQEKAEVNSSKQTTLFKARPLPEYKSPLKPAKSLKKLTIPIEPIFQTDIRAHLRQSSQSVHRIID